MMQPIKRISRKFVKATAKIHFWLAILSISFWIALWHFSGLEKTSYAYTYSLGWGYGYTHYTANYYQVTPLIQESIRVHEWVHLQEGTLAFWDKTNSEIRAYSHQISVCRKRRIEIYERYLQYRRNTDFQSYVDLHIWEENLIETLREYYHKNGTSGE